MKKTICTTLATICCLSTSIAQTVTEIFQMRMAAIEFFQNDYIQSVNRLDYPDRDTRFEYTKLFEEGVKIYNNFLPDNYPYTISPKDYAEKRKNNITLSSQFAHFKLGFPYEEQGKWKINIEYTEDINIYVINYNIRYPKVSFDWLMTLSMEKNKDNDNDKRAFINCKICELQIKNPINHYILIEKTENIELPALKEINNVDKDSKFRIYDADSIEIDSINQANSFYFYNQKLIPNDFFNKLYRYKDLRKNLFGISLYYTPYGFGNNINTDKLPYLHQYNQALSLDISYGLQIVHKNKSTLFFNINLELNAYQQIFRGTYYTQYQAMDSDGESYLRKINVPSLTEKIYHLSASLQPSFEYLLQITQGQHPIFLSLEIGGYTEYRFWGNNTFKLQADYSGLYNYFDGIEFDHYYDYGHFDLDNEHILQNIKDKINALDYGVFGSIGIWYAINPDNILKIGIGYKHGFTSPFEYKNDFILSENYHTYESAVQTINQGLRNMFLGISWQRVIPAKK